MKGSKKSTRKSSKRQKDIPVDITNRQNNELDPAVQEMVKFSPGGALCGTAKFRTPTTIIIIFKLVARRKVVRQKVRKTKLDSRSKKAFGNSRREREVQRSPSQFVISDSTFSLAAVVFFLTDMNSTTTT